MSTNTAQIVVPFRCKSTTRFHLERRRTIIFWFFVAGIAALVTAHHAAREYGGSVQVVAPQQQIAQLLRLARIDEFIPIRKDRTEALANTAD